MGIWNLEISINYTEFFFLDEEDKAEFHKLAQDHFEISTLIVQKWQTLYMQRGNPKKNTDFFEIDGSGIFAIIQNALNILSEYLKGFVEVLPIKTDCGKYYALNVINVIDCLDKQASKYIATNNGCIVSYSLLEFDENKLGESLFFKIPQLPYQIFIADPLYEIYETNDLRGLVFDPEVNLVWYSE